MSLPLTSWDSAPRKYVPTVVKQRFSLHEEPKDRHQFLAWHQRLKKRMLISLLCRKRCRKIRSLEVVCVQDFFAFLFSHPHHERMPLMQMNKTVSLILGEHVHDITHVTLRSFLEWHEAWSQNLASFLPKEANCFLSFSQLKTWTAVLNSLCVVLKRETYYVTSPTIYFPENFTSVN